MHVDKLIQMANRIAEFFAAMPAHDEAVDGVANHLRKFWPPAMRLELLQHVALAGDTGLHPLVAVALQDRADWLQPRA